MPIRPPAPPPPSAAPAATTFTVERATRTLPYVGRIAEDLVRDYARWRETVRAVEIDAAGRRTRGGSAARRGASADATAVAPTGAAVGQEETRALQREAQRLAADIQSALGELAALGVECKSMEDGLLDFPAVVDGEPAYLCWKLGESGITWWHRRDAGFGGRRPLEGATVAGPERDGERGGTGDGPGTAEGA